jgi:hypothetical protein
MLLRRLWLDRGWLKSSPDWKVTVALYPNRIWAFRDEGSQRDSSNAWVYADHVEVTGRHALDMRRGSI